MSSATGPNAGAQVVPLQSVLKSELACAAYPLEMLELTCTFHHLSLLPAPCVNQLNV